jgi:hypothetical protein
MFCKSAFYYKKNKSETPTFYFWAEKQLKQNCRLLRSYNKSGKFTVRVDVMREAGFNPNFFTHYWKNSKGDVYLFVFEYGFLKRTENGKEKYILVTWQEYMNKHFYP